MLADIAQGMRVFQVQDGEDSRFVVARSLVDAIELWKDEMVLMDARYLDNGDVGEPQGVSVVCDPGELIMDSKAVNDSPGEASSEYLSYISNIRGVPDRFVQIASDDLNADSKDRVARVDVIRHGGVTSIKSFWGMTWFEALKKAANDTLKNDSRVD